MKRVVVVGMMVVLAVAMALPAVALVADNQSLTPTGRSAETSFGTAGGAEYNKKVCVKHMTGKKKPPYRYILISKQAYEDKHAEHGDKIVNRSRCS